MERFVDELATIGEEFGGENVLLLTLFMSALQRLVADGFFVVFEHAPDDSPSFLRLCDFILDVSRRTLVCAVCKCR